MKKMIIGFAVLMNVFAVNAADTNPVSEKVQQSFQKEFAKATNISWISREKNIFQATFTYNGTQVEAYFDAEGNVLSTARLISEQQLPVMIIKALSKDYSQYTMRRAEECNTNNTTYYLVTLYNDVESISLKFFSNGDEQLVKRIKNKN
jgi:hypothetical protein